MTAVSPVRPGAVTVWLLPLSAATAADRADLSPAERARAAGMRRGADAFVVVRAALRRALGALLDEAPASVALRVEPSGRPVLAVPPIGVPVGFSVSHGDGLAAVAVAPGFPVGVDVERIVPSRAAAAARALGLPAGSGPERTFAAWCGAEAVAKAAGCGLPTVLRGATPPVAGGWEARPLDAAPGWAGAIAAPGTYWSVIRPGGRP